MQARRGVPTFLPADFAGGLIEPGTDVQLPLLLEVLVGHHIVVPHHLASLRKHSE